MLEDNDYDTDDYCSRFGWRSNQAFMDGVHKGARISACQTEVRIYRYITRSHDREFDYDKWKMFMGCDNYEELNRFHDRYGNISVEKMADHVIRESEYLMFLG